MLNAFYKFPDTQGDYATAEEEYCLWEVIMKADEGSDLKTAWFAFDDSHSVSQVRIDIADAVDGEMYHIQEVKCRGYIHVRPDKDTVNSDRDEELYFFKRQLAKHEALTEADVDAIYEYSQKAASAADAEAEAQADAEHAKWAHAYSNERQLAEEQLNHQAAQASEDEEAAGQHFSPEGK